MLVNTVFSPSGGEATVTMVRFGTLATSAFGFGLVQRPRDIGLLVRGKCDSAIAKPLQRVR